MPALAVLQVRLPAARKQNSSLWIQHPSANKEKQTQTQNNGSLNTVLHRNCEWRSWMFIALRTQSASPTKVKFTQDSFTRSNVRVPESVFERSPQLAMNAVAYGAMSSPRYCWGESRNPPSLVCYVMTSISLLFSTLFSSSSPNNEPYLYAQGILRDNCATNISQPSAQKLTLSPPNLVSTPPDHLRHRYCHQKHQGVMQFPIRGLGNLQSLIVGGDQGVTRRQGQGKTTPAFHARWVNYRTSGPRRYVAVAARNLTVKIPPTYGRSSREASSAGALCPCMSKGATGGRWKATEGRWDGIWRATAFWRATAGLDMWRSLSGTLGMLGGIPIMMGAGKDWILRSMWRRGATDLYDT